MINIMKTSQVLKNRYVLIIIIFIVIVISIGVYRSPESAYQPPKTETKKEADNYEFPSIKTSLKYFSKDDFGGGGSDYAYVGGNDTYNSFPTTTISLSKDDYSNEIKSLPPVSTKEQYLDLTKTYTIENYRKDYEKKLHTDDFFVDKEPSWNDMYKEFGDFGSRFLSDKYDERKWIVKSIKEVDVDNDGKKEKIIYMLEALDNVDQRIVIVKGDKIVFTFKGDRDNGPELIFRDDGNGFYVKWTALKHYEGVGRCCSRGYTKTRFVFEKGEFVPVYEQEVLWVRVEE